MDECRRPLLRSTSAAASFVDSAQARHFVRQLLGTFPRDLVATAELLTSEVVTNALVHAANEAVLTVELDCDHLRVEVLDADEKTDLVPRSVGSASEHGRGLAIVDALASSWGVESRDAGKAVWFEIVLTGA
jgi:anti-sigma regulatory factor (Ser/Thr protein kinase)